MSSTIFYPATSATYDAAVISGFSGNPYPVDNALNTDLGDKWNTAMQDVTTGTNIDFHWGVSVNTFVGGGTKGFAKSAFLHAVFDSCYPGDGWLPGDPGLPHLTISALWNQSSPVSSQGIWAEKIIASGPDPWSLTLEPGVTQIDDGPDYNNGWDSHFKIPIDLTLDDYLPILRFRYTSGPSGHTLSDFYQDYVSMYLEIDWAASHGFTEKWPSRAEWTGAYATGLKILSAGDADSAFNPDTGVWRVPTVGNPVGFKSWEDPLNPGPRTFVCNTENH